MAQGGWNEHLGSGHDFGSEGVHPAVAALRRRRTGEAEERRIPPARRRALARVAAIVSHVGSPPVLAPATFVVLAAHVTGARAWAWAAVDVLLAVVLPLAGLVAMLRRGEVDDIEVSDRRQRGGPLQLTLLMSWFAVFVLDRGGAPPARVTLAQAYAGLALALDFISRTWKISVHAAGAAVFGTVVWALTGSPMWLVAAVIAVGGPRLVLRRHTVLQVAAGGMLGAVVVALLVDGLTGLL